MMKEFFGYLSDFNNRTAVECYIRVCSRVNSSLKSGHRSLPKNTSTSATFHCILIDDNSVDYDIM